ncbi:hypothetical protein KBB49_02460 [Candidatus Saccharibacteria bacterium]|nr:hypothetical protein [Candidatus Saccharibacteria bacterium]
MRRWSARLFAFVVLVSIFPFAPAKAVDSSIWQGSISVTNRGALTQEQISSRIDCTFEDIYTRKYVQPLSTIVSAVTAGNFTLDNKGRKCLIDNNQGEFTPISYSADGRTTYELSAPATTTAWNDPAPAGDALLVISKQFSSSTVYNLSLEPYFEDHGDLFKSFLNIQWKYDGGAIKFVDKNNQSVNFSNHAFSSNGRYLAIRYNGVVGVVDLKTREMTPLGHFASWASGSELVVSSDGRYVAVENSDIYVFDSKNCQRKYSYPNWDLVQIQNNTGYVGCVKSPGQVQGLLSTMGVSQSSTMFQRMGFTDDSSTLIIGGGIRRQGTNPNSSNASNFEWQEYGLKPDLYQPSAQGYLAMGDSFSSGEGDLQGGTWYEPGTDEQGNKSTFEGRNLCHLSRRSYPYLIAKETGYLDGPSAEATTPPSGGLFHSIACSGAVMHNVTGSELGILFGSGDEEKFNNRDNQFRNDYLGDLNSWQPGRVRQLDVFEPAMAGYGPSEQKPEVITLGIAGNDAGFGDLIQACTNLGTCPQAEPTSAEAEQLALTIAMLKPKLVDTYKKVKLASPESRIYVHGYPIFVIGAGGNCGNNVHLDFKETVMVEEGIKYMNSVVEASAREAGVFYIDVSDILVGVNLCSGAEDRNMAFNGATAGNDIDSTLTDLLSLGICIPRTGCIGKESYHPNAKGHELYKTAILNLTSNLEANLPLPQPTNYPLPNILFFGSSARGTIESINENTLSNSVVIPEANEFVALTPNIKELSINQGGLMPGSTAVIEIHSTPQVLETVQVSEEGGISTNVNLPEDLGPGSHQLHILGVNEFGTRVDLYQNIIVGAGTEDFDGDGVNNEVDSCPTVVNSGIDVDEDGIDDACDSQTIIIQTDEPEEEPLDEEPAEFVDKGTPSNETVAGDNDEAGGAVLGTNTTQSNNEVTLSSTGFPVDIAIFVGLLISISAVLSRNRVRAKYRIGQK